jgi:2-methylfumaryl-CoA isomerase
VIPVQNTSGKNRPECLISNYKRIYFMVTILRGMRVVECASFIAAPSCALHLQQMGAQVIRIDPIGGGPDAHRWPLSSNGSSLYWEGLNKGKLSIAVDFASPEGRALVAQLVCAPDDSSGGGGGLFVTNFPAVGFLSHERLREGRKDLITTRIMGWADGAPAVDYTINAAVGVPYMTGAPSNANDATGTGAEPPEPVNHVLPAWDLLAGAYAAFALLAAERHRQATGQGQEVRVPLSDIAIASLGHLGQIAEVHAGADRPKMGNTLFGAFGRDFKTADGKRLMVVAITPRQWSGLVKALELDAAMVGIEAALGVSFMKDEGLRFTHRDVLTPLVEAAIARRTADSLGSTFDANGVCWGPYHTLKSALTEEPRLVSGNRLFSPVTHPSGLTYPTPGAAATFSQIERSNATRAPRQGEHTDQVLAELLGLSNTQIGQLHDRGLVASAPT